MSRRDHDQTPYSDNEKRSLGPNTSQSSYPPSPGFVADEPKWAHHTDTSLRQRIFSIFDSSASTNISQGYVPVVHSFSSPNEDQLPLHAQLQTQKLDVLVRNPRYQRLLQLVCLVILFGGGFSFLRSLSQGEGTLAEAIVPGLPLKEATESSSQRITLPAPLYTDAELSDGQCPPILEGGADAITCRVELAQRKYDSLLARQSRTVEQAIVRYVQQYSRSPPPGFEHWFNFAKENQAVIIDDYGQLEKDLEPLRKVPSQVLRERMKDAHNAKFWGLHQWDFANGTVSTTAPGSSEPVQVFREIMSPFLHKLPRFSVLHNWDDNHRVCGPKDGDVDIESSKLNVSITSGPGFHPGPMEHLVQGCPRNTGTSSSISSDRPSIDLCSNAEEWKTRHGIFSMGNACFASTVPVLSLTKVTSYQDIVTASWCYGSSNYRLFGEWRDINAWDDKKPHLYWRGSNTGSPSDEEHGYTGHRQHLVMLAHQAKAKATELAERVRASDGTALTFNNEDRKRIELPNMPGSFTEGQLSAISRLKSEAFDMNFVNLHGCEKNPSFCEGWKKKIPLAERKPMWDAFENKFLLDLDGNSMSCRFYRLLDSNSLVFKQTIYAEWHDDRIVPWLHYVPVTTDLEELPILLDFFANDSRGQRLAKKIADASKEWTRTALRKVDLSIYTYRQLLELAHIVGHDGDE